MRLYWFKGCPGQYYLYDKPRTYSRTPLASCLKGPEGYRITVNILGDPMRGGCTGAPKSAVAATERHVRAIFPDAEFIRENF